MDVILGGFEGLKLLEFEVSGLRREPLGGFKFHTLPRESGFV